MPESIFYKNCRSIVTHFFRLLSFKITVNGLNNIPRNEVYVVASNHIGHIDPYLLGVIFPDEITYMIGVHDFLRPIALFLKGDHVVAKGPLAIVEAVNKISVWH